LHGHSDTLVPHARLDMPDPTLIHHYIQNLYYDRQTRLSGGELSEVSASNLACAKDLARGPQRQWHDVRVEPASRSQNTLQELPAEVMCQFDVCLQSVLI
jgi:hypothetical protein